MTLFLKVAYYDPDVSSTYTNVFATRLTVSAKTNEVTLYFPNADPLILLPMQIGEVVPIVANPDILPV